MFKTNIYKTLYDALLVNINYDIDEHIKNNLNKYFDLYTSLKNNINNNNNYIYKFIISYINDNKIIIKNSNYDNIIKNITEKLINDDNIYKNNINNDLLFTNIIKKIVNSIYNKNYYSVKYAILNHKQLTINDQEIINDIKNDNIKNFYDETNYKNLIKTELGKTCKSDENYIGRIVYQKLGDNHDKIDSTMIGSIIDKAQKAYSSYYSLKNKNIKSNTPKFLPKDSLFNLYFSFSKSLDCCFNKKSFFTSKYISKNYTELFGNNFINVSTNKYIDAKYMKKIIGKLSKKNNYIIGDKYIEKNNKHIIDASHFDIIIPTKITKKNIKLVEVVFERENIKICFVYDVNENKNENKTVNIKSSECVSIDLGVTNLLTIYNPTGIQNIIGGNFLTSINYNYSKLISDAQSKNNDVLVSKFNYKRNNIINNYFNKIVKWLNLNYQDKKMIIIGMNNDWKRNSNLGEKGNLKFNKIPYMKLINKIKDKFINDGKIIMITEESYTSKCDSLKLEEIKKHEKYSGERIKRGLFSSSTKKLINADINGAINIMRKVFPKMKNIIGGSLYNPKRINIFHEVA